MQLTHRPLLLHSCRPAANMQSSFLGSSLRSSTQRCFVPSRVSPAVSPVVAHYGGRVKLGGGKPWERTEVNHNGKPVKVKMHVKKGDIVQVRRCMYAWARFEENNTVQGVLEHKMVLHQR